MGDLCQSELLGILKNKNKKNHSVFTCRDLGNGKKHHIIKSEVIAFYKLYSRWIFYNAYFDDKVVPLLTETINKNVPIIGDFQFRYKEDTNVLYNENLINEIISIYQQIISNDFEIKKSKNATVCVVLRSDEWYEEGLPCIRVRLQFPFCRVNKEAVNGFVNKKVRTFLRKNACLDESYLFGGWDRTLKDIGDVVPLYGSTDDKRMPPPLYYTAYNIMGHNGIFEDIEIVNLYEYKDHSFIKKEKCFRDQINDIVDEDIDDSASIAMATLPLLLSIFFENRTFKLRSEHRHVIDNISETSSIVVAEESQEIEDEYEEKTETDFELCVFFCKPGRLRKERFDDLGSFMDIGKAFYSATEGSEEGRRAWVKTSKKSNNFNEDFCNEAYYDFENERVSVRTLGWYFKMDDPKKYAVWHNRWIFPTMCLARERQHVIVAKAFYKCFWLKYMLSDNIWYEFKMNRLVVIDKERILKHMTSEFVPLIDTMTLNVSGEIHKLTLAIQNRTAPHNAPDTIKSQQNFLDDMNKLKSKLLDMPYRSNIMTGIRSFFQYDNLNIVLNVNPNYMGCSNCVIDLTTGAAIARPGKPEDFITKKLGVPYRNFNYDSPPVKALLKYLSEVFIEPSVCEYWKLDTASFLYRRNLEKLLRIWIGCTNGSKSILQKMMERWLGDYFCMMPESIYTGATTQGGGPDPALAQMDGAAVGFISEPDDTSTIKGSSVKRYTGGDSFFARACNVNGGAVEATFKTVMVVNIIPNFTSLDEATRNRISLFPFESRWLTPAEAVKFGMPEDYNEQRRMKMFPMDPVFHTKIPQLATALNWLCMQNYAKYKQEGLVKPPYIDKFMADYWSRNDPYVTFIENKLFIPKRDGGLVDDKKYITLDDCWPLYKDWIADNRPNDKKMDKAKFRVMMISPDRLGAMRNNRWYGWDIKRGYEEEEIED
jgi:hypothetical protein